MKLISPVLLILFLSITSCRKDEPIEVPDAAGFSWSKLYFGDWNLSSIVYFEKLWRKDSMDVFYTPELFVTFTDSVIPNDAEQPTSNLSFYYGKLFQDGEEVEIMWQPNSIYDLSNPDSELKLFTDFQRQKFNDNLTLKIEEVSTGNEFMLQKSDIPYVQDSVTYRIAFSSPPPNVGLMVGYNNSDGIYTIDTLKSGNWEWEKKVLQTEDIRDYKLEIVGATDSFFEAIDSDYFPTIALQWSYESANGMHASELGVINNINGRFSTDSIADFGTSPIIEFRLKFID